MKNFWKSIKKPITILAPMDDVTDSVFRQMVIKTARPDVFFTEFVNCDGLCSEARGVLMKRLKFTPIERPIVAQIWGAKPENFKKAACLVEGLGFDGIDINMGCPDKSATKKGACSALINNPDLAREIIEATKKGAPNLPVSVKTRIGIKEIQTKEWIGFLLKNNLAALTVHGRTVKEPYKVSAHWDEIGESVEIRNRLGVDTLIIGNGDVKNRDEVLLKCQEYRVDGVMIGRGIFKNVWAFSKDKKYKNNREQMLKLLLTHTRLFDKTWGGTKNFNIMKKFFIVYLLGLPNSNYLKNALMKTKSLKDVEEIICISCDDGI